MAYLFLWNYNIIIYWHFKKFIGYKKNHSYYRNQRYLNKIVCVLIEKESKKSDEFWSGRTTQNTVVVFPKKKFSLGDFVDVRIENCTNATLIGNGLRISKDI